MKPSTMLLIVSAIFLALFLAAVFANDNLSATLALAACATALLTGFFWRDR